MPEFDAGDVAERLAPLGISSVRPLPGGASSLTYLAHSEREGPVVVKVAPAGLEPVLHRDVLRQARIMRSLRGSGVAVPEVLHEDAGSPPEVPPLFVMAFLEGSSIEPLFDLDGPVDGPVDGCAGVAPTARPDAAVMGERLRAAARTMAQLHRRHPADLGLVEEPTVGLPEEIGRWRRLLQTVDPVLVPTWEEVAGLLESSQPEPMAPAVVHGDFRLGNLLAEDGRINAIIDWEIWTVGDPRVDAGWFLVNADPDTYRRPTSYVGRLPGPTELADIYEAEVDRHMPELPWFQALALFKSTATWSLIVKHNRRRPAPLEDIEAMAPALPYLLERARRVLA